MRIFIAAITLLALTSCIQQKIDTSQVPDDSSNFYQLRLDELRTEEYNKLLPYLHPNAIEKPTAQTLQQVASKLPQGGLFSAELIGFQTEKKINYTNIHLTYEYQFAAGWAVIEMVLHKYDHGVYIASIQVTPTIDSQRILNAPENSKITFQKLLVVFAMLCSLFIMLSACLSIYHSPVKKKWLVLPVALIGISSTSLNWTTDHMEFTLFSITIIGTGVTSASEFSPFILFFTIPVGALIYWIIRKELIEHTPS